MPNHMETLPIGNYLFVKSMDVNGVENRVTIGKGEDPTESELEELFEILAMHQ